MKTTDSKPRFVFQLFNTCRVLQEKTKITFTHPFERLYFYRT
jgi:hypothetical protein